MRVLSRLKLPYLFLLIGIALLIVFFILEVYFVNQLNVAETDFHSSWKQVNIQDLSKTNLSRNVITLIYNISRKVDSLEPHYFNLNPKAWSIRKALVKSFEPKDYDSATAVFNKANTVKHRIIRHTFEIYVS